MPRKGRSAGTANEVEKDSQEKRKIQVRWAKSETQLIAEWFCKRDEDGERVNYQAWTKGNHSDAAERMLQDTGLHQKEGVTKKKTTDKMMDMIKQYKDLRATVEQSGWGTGLEGSDGISHESRELESGLCKTAKELILRRCAWYYEYEELFCDHPGVNPAAIIESGQPSRREGHTVDDNELGGYDKDLNPSDFDIPGSSTNPAEQHPTERSEDSDSSSLHSVLSQIARDQRREARKKKNNEEAVVQSTKKDASESESEVCFYSLL